ncbi:hypothetical protein HD806DRAFT_439102 [Xylariaceae sp. AK1471]|nr:hypothetical protein HD806DRAFT_439102 [Xylariaceae sp. AK1471]
MADPLSIASGALAVLGATQKTASAIYKFIRDCKDARADLTQITGQLSELTLILELIRDDNAAATKDCLPDGLQTQVQAMLTSCISTVQQIENIIEKCRGKPGPLRWTIIEKDKVTGLKGSLEAFKSGLSLALETVNLSLTREIKNNTESIQDDTAEIKRDTSEILDEIYKLRNQLPFDYPLNTERLQLERWVDSLTNYAESIVADGEAGEASDAANFPEDVQELEESDDEVASKPSTSGTSGAASIHASEDSMPGRGAGIPFDTIEDSNRSDQPALSTTQLPKTGNLTTKKYDQIISNVSDSAIAHIGNNQIKSGPNPMPCHMVASMEYVSKIVQLERCIERDVCATLHEDLILRIWSFQTGQLIKSLPVLRKNSDDPVADVVKPTTDTTNLIFCPADPDLLSIKVWHRVWYGGRHSQVEVWHWAESRRIAISPAALAMFKGETRWLMFVPRSTLMYAVNMECIMIVDLATPLISQRISFRVLLGQVKIGSTGNLPQPIRVCFTSDSELCLFWSLSTGRFLGFGGKKLPWLVEIIHLPSGLSNRDRQTASVCTRYSATVMKKARVTARFHLPREIQSSAGLDFINETRRMLVSSSTGGANQSGMFVINMDTGVVLSTWQYPRDGNLYFQRLQHKYAFFEGKRGEGTSVVRIEDGRELGVIPTSEGIVPTSEGLVVSKSNKVIFSRLGRDSNLEFWMTDASLDDL